MFLSNKDTSKNFRYDTKCIKPKISPYNENRHDINKILKKGNYYGTLILSIDSICEVVDRLYLQTFFKNFLGAIITQLKNQYKLLINLAMNLAMNLIIKH